MESFIMESSEETLILLLEFITNLRRPPSFGFEQINPSILVKSEPKSDFLPIAQTCQNILIVPEYSSYEVFKEKLGKALMYTKGHYIN